MDTFKSFETLLPLVNAQTFDEIALKVFRWQAKNNEFYSRYLEVLQVKPESIQSIDQVPFLPIRFFKGNVLKTGLWKEETIFESSGTTGAVTSRHAVLNLQTYLNHAQSTFEQYFGRLNQYHILALLPSYLEREQSSLVAMIDHFIKQTKSEDSGFYLNNYDQLVADVNRLKKTNRKIIVWGVTYALLDVAEKFEPDWSDLIVFETGGMKGRRKEITREALHDILIKKLNVDKVYSEYGMTELLSQAYSKGGNLFTPSTTMKILVREITDPFRKGLLNETGGINVIDLANLATISFIETEDLGKIDETGRFEILGRMDNSDVRGCNLMVE